MRVNIFRPYKIQKKVSFISFSITKYSWTQISFHIFKFYQLRLATPVFRVPLLKQHIIHISCLEMWIVDFTAETVIREHFRLIKNLSLSQGWCPKKPKETTGFLWCSSHALLEKRHYGPFPIISPT